MRTFVKSSLLVLTLMLCAWQMLPASRAGEGRSAGPVNSVSRSTVGAQSAQAPKLFHDKCARCHGEDGRGRTVIGSMLGVPDFTDEKWWGAEKNETRFVQSITEGKNEMPAFGRKLSKREISALATHVRGFRKTAAR